MSTLQQFRPKFSSDNLKHDFLASVVVFLVALPLCMGIAIASGVPVAAGLITGIVGGLVVGMLAGCPLQVSGPAAGLTVIVYEIVQQYGLEMLGLIVLLAGLIQATAGWLKMGQWFRAVSPAVIKGMLGGIGVLILASQFHVMVDDKPKGSGIVNLVTIPQAVWKGLALPEFQSREVRQFRTEMLREVGELHRRQEELKEHVAERVPNLAAAHTQPEADTGGRVVDGDGATINLAPLADEQAQINESLAASVKRLREFEAEAEPTSRAEKVEAASAAAIDSGQKALATLKQNDIVGVLGAQVKAVESIEALLATQKHHHLAAQLGLLTIVIIVLWQGFAPKVLKTIPGSLVAVVVATVVAAGLMVPVFYVEVPDSLWSAVHFPTLTLLSDAPWGGVIQSAILIAAVASAETLLCATAVDQMQQGQRTRYDKELFAQGIGNTICGFLGALPMTGVIVRSSANVHAGGRTRLSAIMHGLWLLIFVAGLAFLLRLIPTAALAAILVYTGYKLLDLKSIRELRKYGWSEVAIYGATLSMIVITDLLTGVLVGIALAAAKLLYTFSHLVVRMDVGLDTNKSVLQLEGAATFVRLPRLAAALERVPPQSELHVDFEHLDYIDHACLDLLMNWAKQHESTGGKLVIDWESLHARFSAENGRNNRKTEPSPDGRQPDSSLAVSRGST